MIISISNNAELTHTSTTEEDLDQALVTLTEEQTTAIMDAMIKSKTF
jgi:hypothetical protein